MMFANFHSRCLVLLPLWLLSGSCLNETVTQTKRPAPKTADQATTFKTDVEPTEGGYRLYKAESGDDAMPVRNVLDSATLSLVELCRAIAADSAAEKAKLLVLNVTQITSSQGDTTCSNQLRMLGKAGTDEYGFLIARVGPKGESALAPNLAKD